MSETERGMYITTLLLHPHSVGMIRLQSANPADDPLIDPKLLTNSNDVSTLIDGELTALLQWFIHCKFNVEFTPSPPLDNSRVTVIVWRLRGNISELLCAGLCDTMFTVSSTLI